jgi:hypothetical protein
MNNVIEEQEGSIIYRVDKSNFNPIILQVFDLSGKLLEQKVYNLEYPNAIFGYDAIDFYGMDKMLDEMIGRHKEDLDE